MALTALLLCAHHAASAEFDLELTAGYAWDDNVGLDELERATGESDEVTSLEAQASASFTYQGKTSLRLSAGLVDDAYQEFSQVDRQTESYGINLETQIADTTIGINWFDVSADLDGEPFLTYERLSPYIAGFLSKQMVCPRRIYLRAKRNRPPSGTGSREPQRIGRQLLFSARTQTLCRHWLRLPRR